ncbi:tetraspanin-7-like [Gadus morhua]|uniref:tetraspanin-7-like n=1 Tax=Gadus morhua TaxID=8049 RepID=UPI0011B6DF7E|nr:tetraspanin-7-like [Gadus morhua]
MSSPLPHASLSPSRRLLDWETEQLAARRLSSPRPGDLLAPPPVPRRPSAIPGYLLTPYRDPPPHHADHRGQPQLRLSQLSLFPPEGPLAPPPAPHRPPARGPPPCCRAPGAGPLLRLGLLAFSGLFWAAGLAVFTLGVWARLSLADYMLLSSNRYPNAPLVLLAAGAAVTAWGFLGCLGVAAGLPGVLRAYGFFQLLTLAAGLAAGLCGLFYRQDIAGGFRSGLQRAVARYGEDAGRADALDSLQRALDCCGADGWQDWLASDWANRDAAFFGGNGTAGAAAAAGVVSLPDSCCARRMGCRNRLLPPEREGGVEGVEPAEAEAAGIHPHGCFRKVFSVVNDNVFHIAASVLGLAFTQAGGIALACLLANRLAPRLHRGGALLHRGALLPPGPPGL